MQRPIWRAQYSGRAALEIWKGIAPSLCDVACGRVSSQRTGGMLVVCSGVRRWFTGGGVPWDGGQRGNSEALGGWQCSV